MDKFFERYQYLWHPLFHHVLDTLNCYALVLYRAYSNKDNGITEEQYEILRTSKDFNIMLEFLKDCYEGKYETIHKGQSTLKELLDVFKPLQINCNDGLVLFKYANFIALDDLGMFGADFWNLYDGLYRECRSVVIDIVNTCIVLAPQAKFFNVNENDEWSYDNIKDKISRAKSVEITNKLDGSNQNYRWYNGEVVGSGSSAIDKNESWRLQRGYNLLTLGHKIMMKDYQDYTFMYEFISPDNQVVVNYTKEQEGLYLFGMRNVKTGKELTYAEVLQIASEYDVPTTELYQDSFDDIMGQLDNYSSNEKEGWVIGVVDEYNNIFKAKLKVNDYVLMHKALAKLISPNAIIKAIADEKWDDFYSKIPMAYRENANNIKTIVVKYINHMNSKVGEYYKCAVKELGESRNDRKTFMIWCNTNIPKDYRGYVISMYNGREINFLTKNSNGYKKLNELIVKEEVK